MAELSSGNDDKNVSRTGSFKLFGKSPSRSFSKKSSSNNPLKRIFSNNKKKSEKQNVSGDERDASIGNEAETEMIEDDAPSVIEKIENVVPKAIEEAKEVVPKSIEEVTKVVPKAIEEATKVVPKGIEEATKVVPKLLQEVVQETKKVDPVVESKRDIADSKDSALATENKPVESFVDKLKEEKEKIEAELHEKAKDSGLEGVYKAIVAQSPTAPSNDQPLDNKQTQERSVNIDEVKGEKQNNEKEDNCVASLAQGLQQICAQWNTKKED